MKRMFRNSMELSDGRILSMSQVFDHQPATFHYPEEWEGYEPVFEIDGKPTSREDLPSSLTAEELAQFIDDATEDRNWSLEGPDHEDAV